MPRDFTTFIGIDLGGARGKTTAVAELAIDPADPEAVAVRQVGTRHAEEPWYDEVLLDYLAALPPRSVVAIDAPLTLPACIRCALPACPGQTECVDPAVVWLNTIGAELVLADALEDRDRIAAVPASSPVATGGGHAPSTRRRPLLSPYTHRATAVYLRRERRVHARETLGQGSGPVTARAHHLRRALAARGFELNRNLIEVSPRATVQALFGERKARGYKRDADPWETRAEIVERLSDSLSFAPTSRLSREEVLRNDHCFEAVLSGYTAFLWARDDWQMPEQHRDMFQTDGWIWAPPE